LQPHLPLPCLRLIRHTTILAHTQYIWLCIKTVYRTAKPFILRLRSKKMKRALLIAHCSLLILFSCQDPLSEPENLRVDTPAGKGAFFLSVTMTDAGRTILPDTPSAASLYYTLVFTPSPTGATLEENRNHAGLATPFLLEAGTYSLAVKAYSDSTRTNLVAQGSTSGIVIGAGGSTSKSIALKAVINGTGTFTYSVTVPTGLTTATMVVTPLPSGSNQTIDLTIGGTKTGTLNPNAGYYNVEITLVKGDAKLVWSEILHVYAGLESKKEFSFSNDDFYKTKYTVTFYMNMSGPFNPFFGTQSVFHGFAATKPDDPIISKLAFLGWCKSEIYDDLYDFDNTPVYNDINLYAQWSSITISLSSTTLTLKKGNTSNITSTVTPTGTTLTWSSSDTDVATVNNSGTVTAVGRGTATITAEANGVSDECIVTVFEGSGTSTDPFLIYDETDLRRVGTDEGTPPWSLRASYKVMADFSVSGEWTPIGSSLTPFTGNFNGNNKTISGLSINNSTASYQGLFGYISGNLAKVENLSVEITITGSSAYVGGIAGYITNGEIVGCSVTGEVSGASRVGGVVGYNSGQVQNCSAAGNVSGTGASSQYIGGVVGYISSGQVQNCSAAGEVSGASSVGGVVGNNANNATVQKCSVTGNVSGTGNYVGGVVGYNGAVGGGGASNCTVQNCSVTGNVSGASSVGGVVGGGNASNSRVENCYAEGEVIGTDNVGGVVGYISVSNNSTVVKDCHATGNVSSTGDHVGGVAGQPTMVILESCYATGNVKGRDNVGGVAGSNTFGSTVKDCYATGEVSGVSSVGGVVGNNTNANNNTVQNCYATGNVSGTGNSVGGVVGSNNAMVQNCYATGNVSGTGNYVGGVMGSNSGTVENCYAKGEVSGTNNVGGVVGNNSSGSTVQNCYATGEVSGTGNYVGGVVGTNSGSTVQYCFATGNVSGTSYVGGVVGRTGSTVSNCVALNVNIIATGTNSGRVVGATGTGTLTNNYARSDMHKGVDPTSWNPVGADTINGADITSTNWSNQTWWSDTATFDFAAIWGWHSDNKLPILKGIPADVQDPKVYCMVIFNSTGGDDVPSQTVTPGGVASKPIQSPTREDTNFIYWYILGLTEYEFSTPVTANITLYARWGIDNEDFGDGAISNIFNVSTNATLTAAKNAISGGGNDANYIINVIADFSSTAVTFGTATGIKVSLRGPGRTMTLASTGNLLRTADSQTVILRGLTLKGRTPATNSTALVYVTGADSAFTMHSGAITGNNATTSNGGGVYVNSGGTFTMHSGEISGNTGSSGGGVYVNTSGTFTMHSGEISGNNITGTANTNNGGGVYVASNGNFTMNGGEISGNTSGYYGGGVYMTMSGTGNTTFTMQSGTISGNKARGGGGVYMTGTGAAFTMHGGEISGNTTTNDGHGGGVFVGGGTFDMKGGEISGNTPPTWGSGGGVYVGNATFTMHGGTISGNYGDMGGGVYVAGTFRIVTGTIYGSDEANVSLRNTATSGPGFGAALFNDVATAQRGTFNGPTWIGTDLLLSFGVYNYENTIRVVDGDLIQ
jgi:hypothetical protein